jgi:cell division protein FtsB
MANRSLRKVKDRSSRKLIQRLRKKASPYRQYVVRAGLTIIVVFVLYSFLGGEFGFLNLLRMERYRSQLEKERRELTAEIVDLESRHERLTSDSLLIQKLAREKYGLAREGEVIVRLPETVSYRPE